MAGNIRTTELNDSIATLIAADSLGYLQANTVLANLVSRDWDDEFARKGQTVQIPFTGTLSVNDKAEGGVVTLQQPADTKATVTLNKHKEVSFLIEDFARTLATPDYLNAYTGDAMMMLAEQIDGDIAALYSGFSQTLDASGANGPLDESDFREARRQLNSARAPLGDRYAVLSEDAEYDFLGIEEAINVAYRQSLGGGALASAYAGDFMGFRTFMDQQIAVTGGVYKNLAFHKRAAVLAMRPLVPAPAGVPILQKVMNEGGIGLRVTMSYNADYLGVQTTIDVLYGVAELRDNHAVVISTTQK